MAHKMAPDLEQLYSEWSLSEALDPITRPTIVVAGAYQGKVMRLMAEMFPDYEQIIGFEPQRWAYARAVDNTKGHRNMILHNKGLYAGRGNHTLNMGEWGTDACSLLTEDRDNGTGIFQDAAIALEGLDIDLFVMNMEGYEYHLLPYLISTGMLDHIDQLAVQFHTKYVTDDIGTTLATLDKVFTRAADHSPSWLYWVRQ